MRSRFCPVRTSFGSWPRYLTAQRSLGVIVTIRVLGYATDSWDARPEGLADMLRAAVEAPFGYTYVMVPASVSVPAQNTEGS